MKHTKGSAVVNAIVGIGVVVTLVATLIGSYISAANYGNRAEQELEAVWVNNQNVLGQYTLKIQEAAQVPSMYKDDLKEVVSAALSARYGADGSKAAFQWIKEHNPNVDSSLYTKLQQIIEAGRNEFQGAQTRLIDVKRTYVTNLGYVWGGFWLKLAGYPKVDLAKYKPVIAPDTAQVFERGVQDPILLRKK
jgi:hypothetical protein